MQSKRSRSAVRHVRGPFLRLDPHPDHASTGAELRDLCARMRSEDSSIVLAADLFCGAGGLSLGLQQAGIGVVLGADHDVEALRTHRHHMPGMSVDWDLGNADVVERVAELLIENRIDILAGGPPCQPFSKAGRSRMRFLVRRGVREPHDGRRDMWRSYLEVIRLARPRAVIMENVPDMALDREMFILRSMVFELESMGYSVQERVIDAWRYGVPQFRQRLILVAIQNGGKFDWPVETPRKVTLSNAISDLPPVEGGWRPQGGADGWMHYDGPRTAFQKLMREGVRQADMTRIFDHITRPVRADDFEAFELLDSESRYSDLPEHLKRYRDDIFDDKYKRLSGDDVSRTITAHIAKDGYWYIHPEQNRTITVREAARIQTFPDSFRFSGPPSAAFKQIGNAVPPRLGYAVGQAVVNALNAETASSQPSSETVGSALAQWFEEPRSTLSPWLRSGNSWSVMLGELLLDRTTALVSSSVWPLLSRFAKASDLLDREAELSEILTWLGRSDRLETAMNLARSLEADSEITEEVITRLVSEKLITQAIADLAQLAARSGEEPIVVTAGALRVATRFHKNALGRKNQRTAGRIAIARMVGFGASARSAQLALLQLGDDVCQPLKPKCSHCPLAKMCQSSTSNDSGAPEPKA